jgi:hypothetical protein
MGVVACALLKSKTTIASPTTIISKEMNSITVTELMIFSFPSALSGVRVWLHRDNISWCGFGFT